MNRRSFGGDIGRYYSESRPWWPETPRSTSGWPNIVYIVLDDVGFAQLGCFGSDIETPVLDRLAEQGLRYTNFHTTALCSPTRSCLLTGRNHHSNGMGRIIELATGFPGYNARIPRKNGFLSEMLLLRGYATFAVGKWHLTPEEECHLAAPRTRWPLGRGFERFYGFMGGETHQFVPALVQDNHQAQPPPHTEGRYHLTHDLVDRASEYIRDLRAIDPSKPFFLYFCTGACHSPHQAPAEWIERYAGKFDTGWDEWRRRTFDRQMQSGLLPATTELSPRPDWVPEWSSLPADERRLYARYMEAFAGYLSHTDNEIGRLLDGLAQVGDLENTLVFVLSDNGASSEGGPQGSVNDVRLWNVAPRTVAEALDRIEEIGGPMCHNNYPWGWTVAGNTPFRRWKREVHEGGVADPLIVSWPARLDSSGGLRNQYVHAIDLVPTILDLLDVDPPSTINGVNQSPIEGMSFAASFDDPSWPSAHNTQYYEMFGCRAIYHQGWKAVTYHPIQDTRVGFDEDQWELYNVEVDPSECHDLAAAHPDRLRELVDRWWIEAAKYQVLPLDNRPFSSFVFERPTGVPDRDHYEYFADAASVPEVVAVNVRNRSHRITAEVEVPASGVEGVILAQGSGLGGWALYVVNGALRYVHNYVGLERCTISSKAALGPGPHTLAFTFIKSADHRGRGALYVDGARVAEAEIPRFTPNRFSLTGAGLTCGYSNGLPVTDEYEAPFRFTGRLIRVVVDVDGDAFTDPEAEAAIAIASQ